jgi:hypothetical protein
MEKYKFCRSEKSMQMSKSKDQNYADQHLCERNYKE